MMKKRYFGLILLCLTALSLVAQSGYTNPVIKGFYPDPSVCRVGDDYYLVNSTFEYFPGVPIFHSKDLINWQQIGHCLNRKSQLNLEKLSASLGIFAPTIRYHKGVFYMVTTNVGGGKGNFYVTATDPAGEWSEPIWVDQPGIDPTLFWDEDGKSYFISTGEQLQGMILSEIDIATGKLLTKPKPIWGGTGGRYPEGPHIYKKDGYYFLLISEGGTEYAHKVTIARSRNIWGPYESCPQNPILTHCSEKGQNSPIQGTGHADLIEAHDGSWWMVFLAFRPQSQYETHHLLGRETFLTPVSWSADNWPVINNNEPVSLAMSCPTLPQHKWAKVDNRSNFDSEKLGMEWAYLRNPAMANYSLTDRKGYLKLSGTKVTLDDNDSPTFVGKRQQDILFNATTSFEQKIVADNDEVGVTVYMNPSSHYDLYVTRKKNKKILCLRYHLGRIKHIEKEIEINDSPLQVKIEGNSRTYNFYYSQQGKPFVNIAQTDVRYLSSETAGGFTGIVLGLYAVSSHESNPSIGYFDWFEYQGATE